MTPDQRLAEIRRRVRKFLRMTIDQKLAEPGFAYGCMADEAFLVEELDRCLRERAHFAHTPAPLPVIDATTPATAMTARGEDRFDAGWNAALTAATTAAEAAAVAAMRAGCNPYQARAKVAEALAALVHVARMPAAPAPLPPAEPPPFTA